MAIRSRSFQFQAIGWPQGRTASRPCGFYLPGRGELERRACMQQGDQLPVGPSSSRIRACMWGANALQEGRTRLLEPAGVLLKAHALHWSRHEFRGADAAGGAASGLCRAVVGRASARCFPHLHAWGSAPKGMSFGIGQPNNQALQCGARPAPVVGRRSMPFLHPPAIGVVVGLLVSPKAPCKSACVMQAALCSAVLLPLSL